MRDCIIRPIPPTVLAESVHRPERGEGSGEENRYRHLRAVCPREKKIRGSGGSLEPPGPLLTHLHIVYMAYSECLPTRLNSWLRGPVSPRSAHDIVLPTGTKTAPVMLCCCINRGDVTIKAQCNKNFFVSLEHCPMMPEWLSASACLARLTSRDRVRCSIRGSQPTRRWPSRMVRSPS
jgi:hypothetical protein